MVNDGTMISGATRLAPAFATPPIEKLASLLSQRRGVATVHTRSRARLVVGPVTVQACAPSLSTLAKSVVQEAPASRDSSMLTLAATVEVHSMRRLEPSGHVSPPFGTRTVTSPRLMTKEASLASQIVGAATLHMRRRARRVPGPVTVHLCAPSSTRLEKIVVHVAPLSRERSMRTLPATNDCHSSRRTEPIVHTSAPLGISSVYSPAAGAPPAVVSASRPSSAAASCAIASAGAGAAGES